MDGWSESVPFGRSQPAIQPNRRRNNECLEAFAVNNGRARFIIFLFGDPHGLESRERSQDGTTNPDGIFTFRRGDDLDFHGGRGQSRDFFLHTFGNTFEHGGTTGQDGVAV